MMHCESGTSSTVMKKGRYEESASRIGKYERVWNQTTLDFASATERGHLVVTAMANRN